MRASTSSLSKCSPKLTECSWVSLLGATVTNKTSFGHWMSAWQPQAVAHSPFPRRVTRTWCREKHTHHLTKVQGWQHNHQQSTFVSFSISFLATISSARSPRYVKPCKINLNLDFLPILWRRWNSQRLSEMMTEDLSHPQHQGIAWRTKKLLDLYRWDSVVTVGTQHSAKLCKQPMGSSSLSQIMPSKTKKTEQESSSF